MKKLQFKRIGILIGATLLISIGVQVYRNIAQFRLIESQLISDIQGSLDTALDEYYAEIAKSDVITLTDNLQRAHWNGSDSLGNDSIKTRIFISKNPTDSAENNNSTVESRDFFERVGKSKLIMKALSEAEGKAGDSLHTEDESTTIHFNRDPKKQIQVDEINEINIFRGLEAADSIGSLKRFTNQIIISITRDSLDFEKINTYLQAELNRREININYGLLHYKKDSLTGTYNESQINEMPFRTVSKSTFLPRGQRLEMYFENTAQTVLKRGIADILTSVLFLLIIAFAFYYLYQTIKNQKEISDIKADLIGNITHEFKTPIATTLSAIEGIEQFNPGNDPEKTKRYLGISKMQMLKLNQMVEKLLETATLDSEQLGLKPESFDPIPILRSLVQKYQTINPEKTIELILPSASHTMTADPFHFENVISNLLDNAQKYGGNEIRVCMEHNGSTKIRVWDNGGNISAADQSRIFEQFYRIPKGNLHDVKGFGIGLYYVQKIIEKHGGEIKVQSEKSSTSFTTIWP